MKQYQIVSYGAGTNSTAMLVGLLERGERPDAITFSDTGGEKPHTYQHLRDVIKWCANVGFPDIDILRGNAPQQIKDGSLEGECLRLGALPSKAYGFSSCSMKWKVEPQNKFLREFVAKAGINESQVTRLVGFDADEQSRVDRGLRAVVDGGPKIRFPLHEWGWGREECIDAIARAGLKQPGKSACFFCPSSKKREILELRDQYPDLLNRALEIERRALAGEGTAEATTQPGLGRSYSWAIFLKQWDESAEKEKDWLKRQLDMFAPEICDACIG